MGSGIWTDRKAALFDMDGTLMDSMWIWADIDRSYLAHFPQAAGTDIDALQGEIEGMGMEETAIYFKSRFGIGKSVQEIQDDWNRMAMDLYRTRVKLKPGAGQLLGQMRERGMKLGICTSNSIELARAALEANGVDALFDLVLTADEVGRGKPYPDIYLEGARRLSVRPEEVIVFEDVVNGVMAARRAGMEVVGVADASYRDRSQDLIQLADAYVEDFRPLLDRNQG